MISEYHVSVEGNNLNPGTVNLPFRTISRAAEIAGPGDTVTVHSGTYREWVNPKRGGSSDMTRITYQAAPGEEVIIKGSEIIDTWEPAGGELWKAVIPNPFFGDHNPYIEEVRGDWFLPGGRIHHTGEVYIDGVSLFEMESVEKVKHPVAFEPTRNREQSLSCWYCEVDDECTTIFANFQERDPRDHLIEINVRPWVFWPDSTGRNYITVRGFIMRHAATHWAPPTALQDGLIGPHWAKGWIIEHNEISDSKCSGISLGKEQSTGQNEWTDLRCKHGTQREREVVFRALRIGWSKEQIGSHIVRNNVIHDCGQTGICGHLGAVFSMICDNHIYDIHAKRLFDGHEIAGIKLHAPIDVIIRNNHIHNAYRGIWLDWQTQGTRVSRNLLWDNDMDDLFIEISHGPFLVANNILLSRRCLRDASQGGAYVHNLFCGHIHQYPIYNRYAPYHFPHSTQVAGLMTILGGDNRYYNNVFVKNPRDEENAGLSVYDAYPAPGANLYAGLDTKEDYAEFKLPMFCRGNVYLHGALPWRHEPDPLLFADVDPEISVREEQNGIYIHVDADLDVTSREADVVTTETLGITFQSEAPFEAADGSPYAVDTDFFGNPRTGEVLLAGPFAEPIPGTRKIGEGRTARRNTP